VTYERIVFVSPTLQPDAGGIQVAGRIALQTLAEYTRERDIQLHHLAHGTTRESATLPIESIEFHFARSRPGTLLRALSLRSARALILLWHRKFIPLIPVLSSRESTVLLCLFGFEAWEQFHWLDRWMAGGIDRFLSISDFTWDRFVEKNPSFRDHQHAVVHLGMAEPYTREIPEPADPPAVLMLGRMSRNQRYNKGHEAVLRAWPSVLERIPEARLWIAGKGKHARAFSRLSRDLGVEDRVTFHGWVSESKKKNLIVQSSCLALPSRGEGFGLVYLEAMRLGRPCLVSTLDAGTEVVDPPESGLSVNPEDRDALVEGLQRLLTRGKEWERWSRRARERYEKMFTESAFRRRFLRSLPGISIPGEDSSP